MRNDGAPIIFDSLDKPNASPQGPGQPHPLTPIARRDERSHRRLPPQAWIIITVAVVLILGFVLWGIYSAIQSLLWEYPWVSGAMGLLLIVVACASLLALAYTLITRLYYWTQQSRIIRSRFDVPIDSMMVLNADPLAMEAAHLQYETAKIASMEHPLITTWTAQPTPQPKVEAPALLPEPIDVSPVPSAVWLSWLDRVPHIMLAAETGGGKTTTALHILASRLANNEQVYIINPNADGWGGLPSVGGGEDWGAVSRAMEAVIALYAERQQERARYLQETGDGLAHDAFGRLTVVLDEAFMAKFNLASGKQSIWNRFVPILGSGARKTGISVVLLTQTANVDDLSISGPLRENYTRIALDSSAAIKLIQKDEPDKKRKEALSLALAGLEYPAVTERRGQCMLLDRSGFEHTPNLRSRLHQVWTPNARPTMAQPTPPNMADVLYKYARLNWTREAARNELNQRGIGFKDELWTIALDRVRSERMRGLAND